MWFTFSSSIASVGGNFLEWACFLENECHLSLANTRMPGSTLLLQYKLKVYVSNMGKSSRHTLTEFLKWPNAFKCHHCRIPMFLNRPFVKSMEFSSLIEAWKCMGSRERFRNIGVQILKNILKMIHLIACFENNAAVEVL